MTIPTRFLGELNPAADAIMQSTITAPQPHRYAVTVYGETTHHTFLGDAQAAYTDARNYASGHRWLSDLETGEEVSLGSEEAERIIHREQWLRRDRRPLEYALAKLVARGPIRVSDLFQAAFGVASNDTVYTEFDGAIRTMVSYGYTLTPREPAVIV